MISLNMTYPMVNITAQTPMSLSYEEWLQLPPMKWSCPEIDKYQALLYSFQSDDDKANANSVRDKIELYSIPDSPNEKYLVTQAILTIDNPMYDAYHLLNHISAWIKSAKQDWGKNLKIDMENESITSSAEVQVATHANFIEFYKVFISPNLVIQIADENKLSVTLFTRNYKHGVYDSRHKLSRKYDVSISNVFPFVQKSQYKITFSKAYIGTYRYFWGFISDLHKELNKNFTKDSEKLGQLRYAYSKDSLDVKYGKPTKIIAGEAATADINKELRFYEDSEKIVFMGKTVDFKDIISCEIVDDPKFIPGRTTSYGMGFSIFGFGIGGTDSYRTPDKTIHNYVVNVKIDSMSTPLIYISTGENEQKANEVASVFEYILRHQQGNRKLTTINRRTK